VAGFTEHLERHSREENAPESLVDDLDESPMSQRLKSTQPDADIREAKNVAIDFLLSVDNVHVFAAFFEEFMVLLEGQSLLRRCLWY
jgi:hypothetical protein